MRLAALTLANTGPNAGLALMHRLPRPKGQALLAEARQQTQEQEEPAQAAEVALYSLRKEVRPAVHLFLATRAGCGWLKMWPEALYESSTVLLTVCVQVLLRSDADRGGIKSGGLADSRKLGQTVAAQSGVMAWMRDNRGSGKGQGKPHNSSAAESTVKDGNPAPWTEGCMALEDRM